MNVILGSKIEFSGPWLLRTCLLDFKDILNSRQNNSKNKLVGEKAVHVTRVHGSC